MRAAGAVVKKLQSVKNRERHTEMNEERVEKEREESAHA
jgi:hypothetical protein